MLGRKAEADRELVELIGRQAASSARAADALRITALLGVGMAVVVAAWCVAVLGVAAGVVALAVLAAANVANLAMSRSQDARARRLAEEHVARLHGRRVTLAGVRGTAPEPWRRAIQGAAGPRA